MHCVFGTVGAQELPPTVHEDPAAAVSPPTLRSASEPAYPDEALARRVQGTVILELTISQSGTVEEAAVIEGPGHGLNEAARAAALHFIFTPASQGGENKAARIRYAHAFRLPVEETSAWVEESLGEEVPASETEALLQSGKSTQVPDVVGVQESSEEVVVRGLRAKEIS